MDEMDGGVGEGRGGQAGGGGRGGRHDFIKLIQILKVPGDATDDRLCQPFKDLALTDRVEKLS